MPSETTTRLAVDFFYLLHFKLTSRATLTYGREIEFDKIRTAYTSAESLAVTRRGLHTYVEDGRQALGAIGLIFFPKISQIFKIRTIARIKGSYFARRGWQSPLYLSVPGILFARNKRFKLGNIGTRAIHAGSRDGDCRGSGRFRKLKHQARDRVRRRGGEKRTTMRVHAAAERMKFPDRSCRSIEQTDGKERNGRARRGNG